VRVVMVSKALLPAAYRGKLAALARQPDLDLIAIAPPVWRDRRGIVRLEPGPTPGYRFIVTPIAFNGRYHWYFYPQLGRLLAELRPDVVHVDEEPYNLAGWQGMRLARRVGARACFFAWQNLRRAYPPPFCWFERDCYRLAGHAIAGNHEAAQVLRAKGYTGPLSIIPQFGIDPDQFAPKTLPPASPFVIGYAGGLIAEKGIETLLKAVAGLSGEWELRLAGEGEARGRLQQLAAALGVAERVRFLPRLPSTAMPDFYRGLHVLVLPSIAQPNWKEQFGRVLIEAMGCAVPVIGSDCGEVPRVIGEAGLLFQAGDDRQLQALLARLQTDPALRRELGERGRQRVLERYTHAAVARATFAVYAALHAEPGGGLA